MKIELTEERLWEHRRLSCKEINLIDTRQRGLAIRFGPRSATWRVEVQVNGRSLNRTIGAWPDTPLDAARKEAARIITALRRSKDPFWSDPADITLREAWQKVAPTYSPSTFENYYAYWESEIEEWGGDERLGDICNDLQPLQELLHEVSANRSIFVGNAVVRAIWSIVNVHQRVFSISAPRLELTKSNFPWNDEPERDPDLSDERLRQHWLAVADDHQLPRRCLAMAISYTGARPLTLTTAKWSNIKGAWLRGLHGKTSVKIKKPYDIPITRQLGDLIDQCRGLHPSLIFPSPRGRVQTNYVAPGAICPRDLRHWYITLAHGEVGLIEGEMLVHHTLKRKSKIGAAYHKKTAANEAKIAAAAQKIADTVNRERERVLTRAMAAE